MQNIVLQTAVSSIGRCNATLIKGIRWRETKVKKSSYMSSTDCLKRNIAPIVSINDNPNDALLLHALVR